MGEDGSKIFLVTWIKSVTTMIFEVSCERTVWLIPHLMAKNLASDELTSNSKSENNKINGKEKKLTVIH